MRSASHAWGDASVWLPLLLGGLVLGAFVATEHAVRFPMMPTSLFAIRSFSAANGVSFCIYASLAGGVFMMSQFFQIAQHASPMGAALRFVPWPLPSLLVAPLVGSLATRVGNRPFLVAGMALQTIGMVWFALVVHASTPYLTLCLPLVLSGIGLAFVFPTVSGEVMSAVPPERMGIAAGVNGSIRELGGVLGVALTATVFAGTGGYATPDTFTTGFTHAIWVCAVIAALGAAPAFSRRPTGRMPALPSPSTLRPANRWPPWPARASATRRPSSPRRGWPRERPGIGSHGAEACRMQVINVHHPGNERRELLDT